MTFNSLPKHPRHQEVEEEELDQEDSQHQPNYAFSSSDSRQKLPRGAKNSKIDTDEEEALHVDNDVDEEEALQQQQQLRRPKRGHQLPSRNTRGK
jgi:hypothetical protein